jgi:hypothetical protein
MQNPAHKLERVLLIIKLIAKHELGLMSGVRLLMPLAPLKNRIMNQHILRISSIIILLLLAPYLYGQQTTTWQGTISDTEWHEETFWSNGVPDLNTVAIIDNDGTVVNNQNAEAAGIIINGSGGILNINAGLLVDVPAASPNPTIGIDMSAFVSFINVGEAGMLMVENAASIGINSLGEISNDGQIPKKRLRYRDKQWHQF